MATSTAAPTEETTDSILTSASVAGRRAAGAGRLRRSASAAGGIELRTIEPGDTEEVARIMFEAFGEIHDHHDFPRDFPTLQAATELTTAFAAHPDIWGIVAVSDGSIVGSNFLDQRGPVRGVGPITVDPAVQGRRVGRRLMEAVVERGADARGVRLLQDAFNTRSLALYASLGFAVREPIALIGGQVRNFSPTGLDVRPLGPGDLKECERLHRRVHGFERTRELHDAIGSPVLRPVVGVRDGRIVAYAAGVEFAAAAHGVAESEQDMADLILGALDQTEAPASLLLPTRQDALLRSCLDAGLRVVKPMTYMTIGEHHRPDGAWFPSVLY